MISHFKSESFIKIHGITRHECHLYLLKISNDLIFIDEDMSQFICAHLKVLLSVCYLTVWGITLILMVRLRFYAIPLLIYDVMNDITIIPLGTQLLSFLKSSTYHVTGGEMFY